MYALVLLLLLVTASSADIAESQTAAAAAAWQHPAASVTASHPTAVPQPKAVCRLHIEGYGTDSLKLPTGAVLPEQQQRPKIRPGIQHAEMVCVGGPVAVAVDASLFAFKADNFRGVDWDRNCSSRGCLVSVCELSHVTFTNSSIKGVVMPTNVPDMHVNGVQVALCACNSSYVVLQSTNITSNNIRAAMARDQTRLVLDGNSRVVGNRGWNFTAGVFAVGAARVFVTGGSEIRSNRKHTEQGFDESHEAAWSALTGTEAGDFRMLLIGGGLAVFDTAELHVVGNSSVYRNACERCYGAGVGVHGSAAKLLVSGGSRIERNTAGSGDGGGVFAGGDGVVVIEDGARLLNSSGSTDGAVFVDGNAQVMIMSNSVIANNRPSYGGAGVCARDASRVALVGPVLLQGNRGINPGAQGVVEGRDSVVVNLTGPVAFDDAFVDDGILYPIRRDKEAVIYTVAMYDNANLSIGAGVTHQGRTLTKCSNSIFLSREPCGAGEYQAVGSCQCCPPTTYGFEVNATVCMGCPPNADCPGGDVVWPLEGYWHSSSRSAQMHRCPLFTASCGDRGRCTEPYTGNLCGKCSPGYGVTQSLRCSKCIAFHRQLPVYIALFVVTVVLVSYTVHATWHDNKAGDTALRPSDLIKVLVQFLQYLVIFGAISVPWPQFLASSFSAAAAVFGVASGQSSLDCLLQARGISQQLPLAIQRQLVYLFIAPVAVLVAVMLVTLLSHGVLLLWVNVVSTTSWYHARNRGRRQQQRKVPLLQLWSRLRVAMLVVAFYAYPTLVKAALSFFACLPIDVAGKQPQPEYAIRNHTAGYFVSDIQQECYAGWHKAWALGLGLPATLVLCIGVPAALLLFLCCNKGKVARPRFQEHYGFLYRNYTDAKLWWEAVWAAQTVLLTAVSVFHFSLKAYYSLLLMGLVLIVSAALQQFARPYIHRRLHRLHLAATCCLFLNIWLALALFTFEFDVSALRTTHTAVGIIMVTINAAFVAWCVVSIVQLAHPVIFKAMGSAGAWLKRACLRCRDRIRVLLAKARR